MIRLSIIFDLDGTLLDTLSGIAETANAVLVRHGFPVHPEEDYKSFVGDGLSVLIERITPHGAGESILMNCGRMFLELYAKNWDRTCRPYDGIEEMLTAIQKLGIGMAVLSNKPHAFTKLFVERFFPPHTFSQVYGQREGFAKKPDPGVALKIAEKQGFLPNEMFFVGDTAIDIRTGRASGMTTVAVTWGFRDKNALEKENPQIIINKPMELLQYVLPFS
jgi:phosphoglycolate phosphatase